MTTATLRLITDWPKYNNPYCLATSGLSITMYSLKHALHFPHYQLLQDGLLEWHSCLVRGLHRNANTIED